MNQNNSTPRQTLGSMFAEQPLDIKLAIVIATIVFLDFLLPLKLKQAKVVSKIKISTGRAAMGMITIQTKSHTHKVKFFVSSYFDKIKINDPIKVKFSLLTNWIQSITTAQTPIKITSSRYKIIFALIVLFLGARFLFLFLTPNKSDWGI